MNTRLGLLGAQAVTVGLADAFLVVPAGALLLATYGAESLTWVYLAAAPALGGASLLMGRAGRSRSPGSLAAGAVWVHLVLVTAGWVVLATSPAAADAAWVTVPLLALSFVSAPIGIVLVRAQATRLLEPRQLKVRFARLAAGFWVGFAVGGVVAALAAPLLGGSRHLLSLSAVGAAALLGLVAVTAQRFSVELRGRPTAFDAMPRRPLPLRRGTPRLHAAGPERVRAVLGHPLVRLIFLYDLLTVAVIQLLDWLIWERAAARWEEPVELTRFLGFFAGALGGLTAVFLVLVSGWLLKRSGVGLGLALAPLAVLWVLVATTATAFMLGASALLFLALACTQRMLAGTFTDGTGRTSLLATYQALQPDLRVRAREVVRLVATPAALVLIAVALIVVDLLDLDARAVTALCLGLAAAWFVTAVLAHRQYGVHLRDVLAHRAWDPAVIRIDDDASRIAVLDLLTSRDPDDVRTGLDALADAGHDVVDHVLVLLSDAHAGRRRIAIETAVTSDCLDSPAVSSMVCALVEDPDPSVSVTAAAAMVRLGRRQRQTGRTVWLAALSSSDPEQVHAALRAATACPHPFFVPFLVGTASYSAATSHIIDALGAHSEHLAQAVEEMLTDRAVARSARERVLHFVAHAGTPQARELLLSHLDEGDTSVAHAAALCLAALGEHETVEEVDLGRRLVAVAERAHRCLQILMLLDDGTGKQSLRTALRDEVEASAERAEALLDLVHDPHAINSAVVRLGSGDEGDRSVALENLESAVGPGWAGLVLALVDPLLDDEARMELLARYAPVAPHRLPEWLRELVLDQEGYWHEPWLRACALYAEVEAAPDEAVTLAVGLAHDPDPDVAETARRIAGLST